MRMLRCNDLVSLQVQSADKCLLQFGQEMKRTAEKCDIAADRLSTGKTADRLVDNRLKNGSGQILLRSTLIDQRLDISLCKYTASGCDRVDGFVVLGIFIKTGCIRLEQCRHLVDEGTGTAGTDSVHSLVNTTSKIYNLGILATELDRYIGAWSIVFQGCCNCDNLLNKGNIHMLGKSESAGTGDHRGNRKVSQLFQRLLDNSRQSLLNIGIMTLIIRKYDLSLWV